MAHGKHILDWKELPDFETLADYLEEYNKMVENENKRNNNSGDNPGTGVAGSAPRSSLNED